MISTLLIKGRKSLRPLNLQRGRCLNGASDEVEVEVEAEAGVEDEEEDEVGERVEEDEVVDFSRQVEKIQIRTSPCFPDSLPLKMRSTTFSVHR